MWTLSANLSPLKEEGSQSVFPPRTPNQACAVQKGVAPKERGGGSTRDSPLGTQEGEGPGAGEAGPPEGEAANTGVPRSPTPAYRPWRPL